MPSMAGRQPGESGNRETTAGASGGRPLAPRDAAPEGRPSARGPVFKAVLIATAGGALLFVVGAILASTAGLLAVSATMGAGIGLVLARARVPDDVGRAALTRRAVAWLAISFAAGAVIVAAVATWLYARSLGGALDPIDYLLATFGPFVPAEFLLASVAATWGASAGPVRS
jgi:hypothetical protein